MVSGDDWGCRGPEDNGRAIRRSRAGGEPPWFASGSQRVDVEPDGLRHHHVDSAHRNYGAWAEAHHALPVCDQPRGDSSDCRVGPLDPRCSSYRPLPGPAREEVRHESASQSLRET